MVTDLPLTLRLVIVFVVLALAGCGGDDAGPEISPAQRSGPIHLGLAANVSDTDLSSELNTIAGTGARWLREDLEWDAVQPERGAWRWGEFDAIVEQAALRGIHVLPILDSSPCWAVPSTAHPDDCWRHLPNDNADFARFAARAAKRYGPEGSFWKRNPRLDPALAISSFEVWNEPYIPGGAEPVSPPRYAAMQKATVIAGRRANRATRWLIAAATTASIAGEETPWAPALADADPQLGRYVDGLSIHIYPSAETASRVNDSATRVQEDFGDALGVKPVMWITELGLAACGEEATGEGRCVAGATRARREANKARLLGTAIRDLAADPSVQAIFVYTLREFDRPFYGDAGLLDQRGRDLPALDAFREAVREIQPERRR